MNSHLLFIQGTIVWAGLTMLEAYFDDNGLTSHQNMPLLHPACAGRKNAHCLMRQLIT